MLNEKEDSSLKTGGIAQKKRVMAPFLEGHGDSQVYQKTLSRGRLTIPANPGSSGLSTPAQKRVRLEVRKWTSGLP